MAGVETRAARRRRRSTGLRGRSPRVKAYREGISIPDNVALTIAFAAGRGSGSGGCNRFTGTYEEDGESISFGPLAATRMACVDEVMTAERAYFAALETVSSWSATDAELTLSNEDGDVLLRYEASSA